MQMVELSSSHHLPCRLGLKLIKRKWNNFDRKEHCLFVVSFLINLIIRCLLGLKVLKKMGGNAGPF